MASLVLSDSLQLTVDGFEKLPDQIMYPYAEPYDLQKHVFSKLSEVSYPPPPPPPMAAMPMGMMGPQQGMGMPGGMMGQGFMPGSMQPAPPGTHQQQQQYQQMQMQHMHQMQQTMMNPGMNDAPLEFNINKNKPPMPISDETQKEDELTLIGEDLPSKETAPLPEALVQEALSVTRNVEVEKNLDSSGYLGDSLPDIGDLFKILIPANVVTTPA
uniref:Uncharacterized protein n=1 Tax=Timema bartmani TaxID=61472 RepID=A0A7R9I715_9NEOP|nr:unnamed protein product [Timema bartmani]